MRFLEFKNRFWFNFICALLVIIAIFEILEKPAYDYIKGISEKNLGFLGLVTELKLILSGVSDFIPFLKEHNGTITESLEKAEHYLMIVNVISLVQLMLLEISKTLLVKVLVVSLFITTFFRSSRKLSSRLLILVLALNPGLTLYSVTMHHLSETTSIDYGNEYLVELKASVDSLQVERSKIMQEHADKLNEIDKDKKGIVFFKKLKEDISYDLKKAKTTIKGDYSEIRLLIRDGGKEIVRKLFIFCTMVLFSLLIVPIGYMILVYTVYKTVITSEVKQELQIAETYVKDKTIETPVQKIEPMFKWLGKIFKSTESKIEKAKNKSSHEIQDVEDVIKKEKDALTEDEDQVDKKFFHKKK